MVIALLFVMLVFGFFQNLAAAWFASHVWTWFCAENIGRDPGLWAWFGVFAIADMMFTIHKYSPAEEHDSIGDATTSVVAKSGGSALGIAIGCGMTWCVGKIVGVIP